MSIITKVLEEDTHAAKASLTMHEAQAHISHCREVFFVNIALLFLICHCEHIVDGVIEHPCRVDGFTTITCTEEHEYQLGGGRHVSRMML